MGARRQKQRDEEEDLVFCSPKEGSAIADPIDHFPSLDDNKSPADAEESEHEQVDQASDDDEYKEVDEEDVEEEEEDEDNGEEDVADLEEKLESTVICECGTRFFNDDMFRRKCGARRPEE